VALADLLGNVEEAVRGILEHLTQFQPDRKPARDQNLQSRNMHLLD
jgi:hypothetical protein